MQQNDMADKRRLLFDGEEIPGLVNIEELSFEEAVIEVPELNKIRKIKNCVTPVPILNCIYKTNRNTDTYEFFKNFKERNEVKQCTMIQVDASNTEYKRTLFPGVECAKFTEPAYDAASPTYAQTSVMLVPYDYIQLPG
jgi:hypothetical protein